MTTHMLDHMRGFSPFAACNAGIKSNLSDDPSEVTCLRCKKTAVFKKAKEDNFVRRAANRTLSNSVW